MVQIIETGLQKTNPPPSKPEDKCSPLNVPKRILPMNRTPPAKTPPEEEKSFKKIFSKYFSLFKKRPSPKEKNLFKQNFKNSEWQTEEIEELLEYFAGDRYLKATTRSINRIFAAETVLGLLEIVKMRLRKEPYHPRIIEPLGPLTVLSKIFTDQRDIFTWASA